MKERTVGDGGGRKPNYAGLRLRKGLGKSLTSHDILYRGMLIPNPFIS